MRYVSTRGQAPPVSFLDAVLEGLAPDGGLYVPETWPVLFKSAAARRVVGGGIHSAAAMDALIAFAGGDIDPREAATLVNAAYIGATDAPGWKPHWPVVVTPLVQIGPGQWVQELFHGPSLSFKDVAMQLIGPLYDLALAKRDHRLSVVCATSGDTGGAAAEALKNRERVDLFILLPKGRVSEVQRRFMTASGASNVHAIEIDGDFDACQALVKALFADRAFADRAQLSGVNSINWARILAQSVYFHVAAHTLCGPGPVHFSVPTGNFGDAFSGYVAKACGAPIGAITLATNANDILARAIHTGRYERAARSQATLSPAMDIQVASNFERILFEALARDGEHVRRLYEQFAQAGAFDIPGPALDFLRAHFSAAAVSDAQTVRSMQDHWDDGEGYLACPHTAVGLLAPALASQMDTPIVALATAHPAKFPETVKAAVGIAPPLPAKCADLFDRPEAITPMADDVAVLRDFIRERSRAWT